MRRSACFCPDAWPAAMWLAAGAELEVRPALLMGEAYWLASERGFWPDRGSTAAAVRQRELRAGSGSLLPRGCLGSVGGAQVGAWS